MNLQLLIQKNIMLIAFIGIVAGAAILYGPQFLSVAGVTVMSCDNAEYKTTDANYQNGDLFCAMAITGTLKSTEFTFDKTFMQSKFGLNVEKTGRFSATMDGSPCSYRAMNVTNYVYTYMTQQSYQWSSTSAKYYCKAPTTPAGYTAMGNTPISCSVAGCGCYGCTSQHISGCEYAFKKTVGAIYYLDPSHFDDFSANLSMNIDGQIFSGTMSQKNPTLRTDAFTAEYLYSGEGAQSCPAQPDTAIYVANTVTTNPLSYRSKSFADSVIDDQRTILDAYAVVTRGNTHNTLVEQFLSSSPSTGQWCSIATTAATTINDAKMSCNPVGTVKVPVFNLYVNAEKFAIVIPSGTPKIINASVVKTEAATRSTVKVQGQNIGSEAAAFDFGIQCAKDLSPFTTRASVGAGETKEVEVSYEGAGLIGDCTVTMRSVNSPDKVDSKTVKLTIYPFCAKSAPSGAHEKVFTEFGCAYVCPTYGTKDLQGTVIDVLDSNCARINNNPDEINAFGKLEDYDRCFYNTTDCTSRRSYSGLHCTGIGTYAYTNSYMDDTAKSHVDFAPEVRAHQYFIVTDEGKGVCNYVDEYGYSSGQPIAELIFDYSQGFPEASSSPQTTSEEPGTEIPTTMPPTSDFMQGFLIVGVLVVLTGFAYWYYRMRRK